MSRWSGVPGCPSGSVAAYLPGSSPFPHGWLSRAVSAGFGRSREQAVSRLGGFRSGPVADASGAPVLRDQGPIGRPGTARPIKALTLACHAVSASSPTPGQRRAPSSNGLPGVTVTDRCIPLVPAAYGTRVARPVRTTMLAPRGVGSWRPLALPSSAKGSDRPADKVGPMGCRGLGGMDLVRQRSTAHTPAQHHQRRR